MESHLSLSNLPFSNRRRLIPIDLGRHRNQVASYAVNARALVIICLYIMTPFFGGALILETFFRHASIGVDQNTLPWVILALALAGFSSIIAAGIAFANYGDQLDFQYRLLSELRDLDKAFFSEIDGIIDSLLEHAPVEHGAMA